MIINIKKNKSLLERDIIGIFDLDNATVSVSTRSFLQKSEKNGDIENISDLPKSFIVFSRAKKSTMPEQKDGAYPYSGGKIYFSKKTVKFLTSELETYMQY